jgi:hypothetical protein
LTLSKLEEVFAMGGTDIEACGYANIAPATLYKYQERCPEFVERKKVLKEKPVLLARKTIMEALADDSRVAQWYVERRDKDFNLKQEVDLTSKGEKLEGGADIAALAAEAARLLKEKKT